MDHNNNQFEPGPESANSANALQTLHGWLEKNGWDFRPVEGYFAFKSHYREADQEFECFFQVVDDYDQFIFYAVPPLVVPDEKLSLAAEFVARVNAGMRIGNYEVDFRNGQVRIKSSLNFQGAALTEVLLDGAVQPALEAAVVYMPGLLLVLEGKRTPKRAINEIDYGE